VSSYLVAVVLLFGLELLHALITEDRVSDLHSALKLGETVSVNLQVVSASSSFFLLILSFKASASRLAICILCCI